MRAYFEVDSLGRSKLLYFTPSRNADYNKMVEELLKDLRFRAAVGRDGTPLTDTACISETA